MKTTLPSYHSSLAIELIRELMSEGDSVKLNINNIRQVEVHLSGEYLHI